MLKMSFSVAIAVAMLSATVAEANDGRYGTRPPVTVSADLSAPWVMQLTNGTMPRVYAQPRVVSQPQAYQSQRQVVRRGLFQERQPAMRAPVQNVAMAPAQRPVKSQFDPMYLPQMVDYDTKEKAGTIVIDTNNRFLYLVAGGGKARRYGVGVGKPGFEWAGSHKITRKAEWPSWNPPKEMISREAAKGHYLPASMEGGPENPLGARAMYLGSTLYRIHGTNAPWTIGYAVSSGCIRMRNQDVTDLYERVDVGTRVIVI